MHFPCVAWCGGAARAIPGSWSVAPEARLTRSFELSMDEIQKNFREVKDMSLRRIEQLRKGTIALSVFQSEEDGKVLLSVDKDFVSRRVKGPLFSHEELGDLLELMDDYTHNAPTRPRMTGMAPVLPAADYCAQIAQAEIAGAVGETARKDVVEVQNTFCGAITVLPTLPKFRYVHTCPHCQCHVQSTLRIGATELRFCSGCERVESVYVNGIREG